MFGALQVKQQLEYSREEGRTIRQPSTAIFAMSSEDRYKTLTARRESPSYPFKFLVYKNESLLNGFFTRLALTEFRMVWTLPNIANAFGTSKLLFAFDDPAFPAAVVVELDDGFYTPKELAAAINQQFTDMTYPIVAVFSEIDGTIIFNGTGGVEFKILPYTAQYFVAYDITKAYPAGSVVSSPAGQFYYAPVNIAPGVVPGTGAWVYINVSLPEWNPTTVNYKGTQLFDMLQLTDVAPGVPFTAFAPTTVSGVPDLRWTDYIDITSPQLTYQQELKDTTSQPIVHDMLARIYLDEPSGADALYEVAEGAGYGAKINGNRPFTLYRQFTFPKQIRWARTQPIGQAEFEIFDDQGRSIQELLPPIFVNSTISQAALSTAINFTLLVSED